MYIRVTIAQLNSHLGNFDENLKKIYKAVDIAEKNKADFVIFPELFLTGYPPEDLILRTSFLKKNIKYLEKVISYSKDKNVVILLGYIDVEEDAYNSMSIIHHGKFLGKYHKQLLPNYSVFDEHRYFKPGKETVIIEYNSIKVGLNICEDIWSPIGPLHYQVLNGAQLILNASASPYYYGKRTLRKQYLSTKSYDYHCPIVYCNLIGGQDEVVFDGGSIVTTSKGDILYECKPFDEEIITIDIPIEENLRTNLQDPRRRYIELEKKDVKIIKISNIQPKRKKLKLSKITYNLNKENEIFKAITLGLKDYIKKNGFKKVVIGLSGGMDSSLVAAIATEALGKENVVGILMPSMYSSEHSIKDAIALAENLGIKYHTLKITDIYYSFMSELKDIFKDHPEDITEENIQARIRGTLLMALSNKFGYIVLATGNKSEIATGYSTLYGDMVGGFSPIKDVYKTEVYKIAKWYNEYKGKEIIPHNVFVKPPSAELRPDQKDQDTLPPYEILDEILKLYIEKELSVEEISEKYDLNTVKYVAKLVDKNEYKRRQGVIGVKVTERSFGKDRRMPITNQYKEW
ncbi:MULTISPECIES: NAD+ synthase [unclassified Thermosipho (in: thermotogales)]|uniref:NAD+ synthase n=1 Tax=unclassified Thermosipho (in: thermotogales) TaxID=2676525 RepID=UPI0009843048|nr:NAD+ synthase [Thermosipho sp. 1223]MBT1247445.1 NAD synthetase [Thermosipho sp. 1244]OOC46304.1 NAD synthetase [Thermosipho sp. 1223]